MLGNNMGKTIRNRTGPFDMFERSPRAKYSKSTHALRKKDKHGHHQKRKQNKNKMARGDYELIDLNPHFKNSWINNDYELSPERMEHLQEVFDKQIARRGKIGRFNGWR